MITKQAYGPTVTDEPRTSLPVPPAVEWATAVCTTSATAAAVPLMRHFAAATARRWAVSPEGIDGLSLVVTELVTNAVLHSGSPEVTALLAFDGVELAVEVRDAGQWRHPSRRRAVEDAEATSGRGLDLVRGLATWWRILRSAAGTRVTARLLVAEADSCSRLGRADWQAGQGI